MSDAAPAATLHSYWRSSCSWRVRLALRLKGVPYSYEAVPLAHGAQHAAPFRALNPAAQVPVLRIDGVTLRQSVAILEYLEETRPAPPLLPRVPAERAHVRAIVEAVNAGTQPLQNLAVLEYVKGRWGDEERLAFARHWIEEGLRVVEALLKDSAGECCVGDDVSFADLLLVPQVYNAERVAVDMESFPTVVRVVRHLERIPAFVDAHADRQPDAPMSQT
ncbi:Glutathione S-transferase [Chondrus crispus]|uniref:Glutathione S-transferase n=1 Tax=Chondrus crispus TaxID=2769 RepID=R7QAF3_CHOCR|nr:Glutathione S-transferase [Chondrus crispus]CDF35019.1 Glutathione S-transferase [Chondrus crispus]|eukprot:XP_005714838.1 Glutathione S-transferase [Chondrus crispus]